MKTNHRSTTGYILAGGQSSRMGEDKGLKLFLGKPLIQMVIEQMLIAVDKVVIVANNMDYNQFGLEVIEDKIKNSGPAGGIYTALQHSKTEKNFITSCDMPFIAAEAIQFMLRNSSLNAISIPLFHNKLEPLFGVYPKTCLPHWKASLEKGIFKLTELAKAYKLNKITVDKIAIFSEKHFQNINTLNDFNSAIEKH